jgi:hypothetical protein
MSRGTWKTMIASAAVALAAAPAAGSAAELGARGGDGLLTALGEYVLVGGGVSDFSKDAAGERLDTGGTWDARLGLGSRSYVGGEVAYVGSYRSGVGANPDVLGNGVEGVLRLQLPYVASGWLVEPFVFGGIGWTRFSLRNEPAGARGDDVGVVPFGAGVTLGRSRFLVDARFTWRSVFDGDLALSATDRVKDLDHWSVGASVGVEF